MFVVYVGPHEAVDIEDLTTGFVRPNVARNGSPVEVPDEVGRSLLAQGSDHWTEAKPSAKAKEEK